VTGFGILFISYDFIMGESNNTYQDEAWGREQGGQPSRKLWLTKREKIHFQKLEKKYCGGF